ncbi:MAG: helix-turn-helix domain containing protein [Bacteroidia bacterium]|nr:helix-turn-helix domain containing protein [Bacteroidia bacterium]
MEENILIQKALEMHKAGNSIRNIAALLGTSKTKIHRWIQEENKPTGRNEENVQPGHVPDRPEHMQDKQGQGGTSVQPSQKSSKPIIKTVMDNNKIEKEKTFRDTLPEIIEQDHQVAFHKKIMDDHNLEEQLEKLRLENLKLNQQNQVQKLEEKSLHWDMIQFFKNELELIQDSNNKIKISQDELAEKIKLLKQLLETLEKHCFKYDIEAEKLAYHSNLKQLLQYFKLRYKKNQPGKDDNEDDDEEPKVILVKYNYAKSSLERIKMLIKAEFGLMVNQ